MKAAKDAVDLLLRWVNVPDQVDPEYYIAKVTQMFSEYPVLVMMKAANIIPERSPRPHVSLIRNVLDEIYAPIQRAQERERAEREAQLCLPPPNPYVAPERRHHLVLQMRKAFGIPETGLPRKHGLPPPPPTDPYYSRRLADDLETRRVRNELLAEELQQKEQTNDSRPATGPEP